MGDIGTIQQRYDVLAVGPLRLTDEPAMAGHLSARRTIPSPEPMPAPYPEPMPEPSPGPPPDASPDR